MYVRKNYSEHVGRNNTLNFFFVKLLIIENFNIAFLETNISYIQGVYSINKTKDMNIVHVKFFFISFFLFNLYERRNWDLNCNYKQRIYILLSYARRREQKIYLFVFKSGNLCHFEQFRRTVRVIKCMQDRVIWSSKIVGCSVDSIR